MEDGPTNAADLIKLLSAGGATAALVLGLLALATDRVVTRGTMLDRIGEIRRGYDEQIAELRRQRDQNWDLANRNAGSQQIQASAVRDAVDAILHALETRRLQP